MLLALAVQLALGASAPRLTPVAGLAPLAGLAEAQAFCHTVDTEAPAPAPAHSPDCSACLLCTAVHAQAAFLGAAPVVAVLPAIRIAARAGRPPPSRAPPARLRPPNQPRAPPVDLLHA